MPSSIKHRFREPVSGFTHLSGALIALIGFLWLVGYTRQDPLLLIGVVIYGVCIIGMFTSSALLHLHNGSLKTRRWLRKCDHAAIYLAIAGTYTPLCISLLDGAIRWVFLVSIWLLAIIGILYKFFYLNTLTSKNHISTISYVLMGWIAVLSLPSWLPKASFEFIILIVGGGLMYRVGAVIFALERPNLHPDFGHHELWHIMVLLGSGLHFWAFSTKLLY
ncbi:hemolysin III family protein [Anaerolineales bacterium]